MKEKWDSEVAEDIREQEASQETIQDAAQETIQDAAQETMQEASREVIQETEKQVNKKANKGKSAILAAGILSLVCLLVFGTMWFVRRNNNAKVYEANFTAQEHVLTAEETEVQTLLGKEADALTDEDCKKLAEVVKQAMAERDASMIDVLTEGFLCVSEDGECVVGDLSKIIPIRDCLKRYHDVEAYAYLTEMSSFCVEVDKAYLNKTSPFFQFVTLKGYEGRLGDSRAVFVEEGDTHHYPALYLYVQVCPDGKGNKYQEYQQIYGIFIGESRDAEYLCIGDGGLFSYFDYDDIESSLTTERFEDLKDYKRKLSEKQTGEKEIDKSINAECDFTYVNRGNFLCMKGVESYSGILGLVTPEQWNLWNGDIPQVYMIANYYMICEKSNHRVYLEEYFRKGEKTSDYDYSTAEAVEYCNKKLKAQYEAGDKRIHNNAEILKLFEEDNISKFTYEDYLSLDRDVYNTIVNICRD